MPSTNASTVAPTYAATVALAAVLLLAGCLGGLGPDTPTTTTDDDRQLAHEVRIENHLNESRTVTVTISQAGEVVDEGTYEVEPGFDVVAYGWEERTLDGNDTFVVRMQPEGGDAEQVVFTVDDCHGDVFGYFDEEGFGLTYSVC